jgi:hypothetical protein
MDVSRVFSDQLPQAAAWYSSDMLSQYEPTMAGTRGM